MLIIDYYNIRRLCDVSQAFIYFYFDFFLNKNYTDDVGEGENAEYVMDCINRLREPIRNLGGENKTKAMHYIQNLTKLSKMV